MPANFPDVWLKRVKQNLDPAASAPFLEGIAELDVNVVELGAGSAGESNIIYVPETTFQPEVLINNTTYPIGLQVYTDGTLSFKLDKYQTKVTTLSDDQIIGAAYDKIDAVTKSHTNAINSKKNRKAIHSLAPNADAALTPVLVATGTAVGGRKTLTYADIVALKSKCDTLEWPEEGRRLVLSTDHMNDLLLDRQNFGDQLVNYANGKTAPIISGFQVMSYIGNPYFNSTTGAKLAFGAVPTAGTDFKASVAFVTSEVVKKTGLTKQYFAKADIDPENQTNRLNYRHYFIVLPYRAQYIAAIRS